MMEVSSTGALVYVTAGEDVLQAVSFDREDDLFSYRGKNFLKSSCLCSF